MYVLTVALFLSFLLPGSKWDRFRGPNGSGVAPEEAPLPLEFGPEKNVVWKTELPPGHSSPILTEQRIFLTAFEEDDLLTYALDRQSGRILWRQKAPRQQVTDVDARNNAASPSPAVDDKMVYVFFPDFGLLAYDHEGNEKWRHPLGPFKNVYGMGASPIVVEDKVVLVCDQNLNSYLLALDKMTGEVLWKTERPEARSGHSTPVLHHGAGGLEILVPGSFLLTSYAADTGEKLWWVSGLSFEMKSTPVIYGETIFVNGYGAPVNQPGNEMEVAEFEEALAAMDADGNGNLSGDELEGHARSWFGFTDLDGSGELDRMEWDYYAASVASRNGILRIRLGGEGDMTEQNVVWTYHKRVPQLPSPIVYGDVLYMVNDGGVVTTLNPESGAVVAQGRLKGAVDNYYASPVAADGKIYFASELGKIAVVERGGKLDVVAVNDLEDLVYATPAIADGRIYIRTRNALYCFGLEGEAD